jgi:hypothetical protein
MTNCVAVVAINGKPFLNYTKPLLEQYCKKTNSDLVIIDKPLYNIKGKHKKKYNYFKFEKNQVYNLFENYDKVLRLDLDIVIHPDAPNYFDLDDDYIYVTEEHGRSSEISQIKKDLGNVRWYRRRYKDSWNYYYFNGGVVLASKKHKEVFNISDINFDLDLGLLKEQNVLNWKVNKLGVKIKDLGPLFNFFAGAYIGGVRYNDFDNDELRRNAYFIHHTIQGNNRKILSMKKDIDFLYNKIKTVI